jgi:hypothetical protein
MGFNSAFKGLKRKAVSVILILKFVRDPKYARENSKVHVVLAGRRTDEKQSL